MDGWPPGSEIIVPAVSFVATANAVIDRGFEPAFCGVDPRTYDGRIESEVIPVVTRR